MACPGRTNGACPTDAPVGNRNPQGQHQTVPRHRPAQTLHAPRGMLLDHTRDQRRRTAAAAEQRIPVGPDHGTPDKVRGTSPIARPKQRGAARARGGGDSRPLCQFVQGPGREVAGSKSDPALTPEIASGAALTLGQPGCAGRQTREWHCQQRPRPAPGEARGGRHQRNQHGRCAARRPRRGRHASESGRLGMVLIYVPAAQHCLRRQEAALADALCRFAGVASIKA